MNTTAVQESRGVDLDELAVLLAQQASSLSRLVFSHGKLGMTRSESSLLVTLRGGPQRITALAELEGLAQPTVTVLVKRMEERGWVSRGDSADDGRVVLVSLTTAGRQALEQWRERYRPRLRAGLEDLSEAQLAALVDAAGAYAALVDRLQSDARGERRSRSRSAVSDRA
jgi:DNA-binding MarR family transcriptional regulator